VVVTAWILVFAAIVVPWWQVRAEGFAGLLMNLGFALVMIAVAGHLLTVFFTKYTLGENELVIERHWPLRPVKIRYDAMRSARELQGLFDFPHRLYGASNKALEITYSGGKHGKNSLCVSPKDMETFKRELRDKMIGSSFPA